MIYKVFLAILLCCPMAQAEIMPAHCAREVVAKTRKVVVEKQKVSFLQDIEKMIDEAIKNGMYEISIYPKNIYPETISEVKKELEQLGYKVTANSSQFNISWAE